MTDPHIIRRNLNKIMSRADFELIRLAYAVDNLKRNTPDGYPTKASGTWTDGGRPTATLTPTEAAAHTRLGDLLNYPCNHTDPTLCTEPTHYLTGPTPAESEHDGSYHPGTSSQLDDLNDHLEAALASLAAYSELLTRAGVPPTHTPRLRCPDYGSGHNCHNWGDPDRTDGRCVDCGRRLDRATRDRKRYHAGRENRP